MEQKYIKDFVIALVVILLISFGIKDYYLYNNVKEIKKESKYKEIALGEQLLNQIQNIENSIQDRKQFVFTITKDPLEQHLIVRTQKDLEKQWREKVENMIRLESTIIPENGPKMAAIAYGGKTEIYKIGDKFENGEIVDIREGEITYAYHGKIGILKIQQIPPKPVEISDKKSKKHREYNW
ncbi:MAG: hypothetical protein ISS28_03665 [Candidatus Cloacimonetes bacterium]|nr:hypothetical protein [Candidatus Cloacimonadota bacterium]MBL7086190.1 hypothetical protein [Candidatus Cloacimonadota bacterium]